MARFFVASTSIAGGTVYIGGADYAHMKVLRIRNGELFTLCDGEGTDYTCRLADEQGSAAVAEVLSSAPSQSEPETKCTVYAAWPKGDKAETVVQKAVELGAVRIVFFPSARCVMKVDRLSAAKKVERLAKIAREAAMQSGRGIIPAVAAADSFRAAVEEAAGADSGLFLYEDEKQLGIRSAVEAVPEAKTFSLMTGPEGGFDPAEAQAARDAGLRPTLMGPRILRCETAPLAALSAVLVLKGEMG